MWINLRLSILVLVLHIGFLIYFFARFDLKALLCGKLCVCQQLRRGIIDYSGGNY